MNYTQSIKAVNDAQAAYFRACDDRDESNAEDVDFADQAFVDFQQMKKAHKAQFGSLVRIDGQYI